MKSTQHRFVIVLGALLIALFVMFCMSLAWGSYVISPLKIPSILVGMGSKYELIVIHSIRLPRILVAIVVGCALAIAGGTLQTLTQNDLADSGLIGINAGASLAAVLFITSQTTSYYSQLGDFAIFVLPFIAMVGSLVSFLFIYLLSLKGTIRPERILLVGIGVNIAINAFIIFYSTGISQGEYNRILVWTSGSLWGSQWKYFFAVSPLVLIICCFILYHHKTMDVLNLKDDVSIGLGVPIEKIRKRLLILAVLLAGLATSVAGNISFLGLIAPHMARRLVGPRHKHFLITGAIISAILILFADTLSRNVFSPIEIPVGITISLIGVPYFLYLMLREAS